MDQHRLIRTALCLMLLAVTIVGAEEKAAAPTGAETPDAKGILVHMAEFLGKTQRFTVTLTADYDVLQKSGQMIEFRETRRITESRPDGLRVEVEQSDGDKQLLVYDGKDLSVSSSSPNVYAQTSKPGGVDPAVVYFVKDLRMRLPLAMVLLSRFPAEIERRTQSIDYVEKISMDGQPAHHLAGRTETVDYQFWIADGPQPLLLRAVLTYKNSKGEPQFRAQFSDWNLAPKIPDAQFAFTPADGAQKIAFAAQVPKVTSDEVTSPKETGEKK